MKKNEQFSVTCEDITDQGYGVVHIEGMTVFVKDLLPEEKARIQIVKVLKKYAIARIIALEKPSSSRVVPACAHASQCGGCAFQHMDYASQLKAKQKQLQTLFSKVNPDIQVLPVLGMENPYYFRNKAQFPIQVRDGKILSGFYKSRTNDIVDLQECKIQSKAINEVYAWIRQHLPLSVAENLRHIFIRASETTGEIQVVFIGRSCQGLPEFAQKLHEAFAAITSILFNENQREDNVILGEHYQVLYGRDYIMEECLGLKIQLHFKSFFQVNPRQMEVLYQRALQMADLKPEDTVLELYAGTGTIGMLASQQVKKVTGVEIVPEAVENARQNLAVNGITNAEYICMDASEYAAKNAGKANVVIVDPPRKGMTEQGIQDIATLQPQKVVYISCNPHTLARDLESFQKEGYFCLEIQPVDMFAHSANIECIALLEKQKPSHR